ncbi:MAG: type-F conjugative transfer system protein TrbI [Bifidobacterium longum]|nr:type-F conjugative transfer system protein TrbI [Bifidobacterium longum]
MKTTNEVLTTDNEGEKKEFSEAGIRPGIVTSSPAYASLPKWLYRVLVCLGLIMLMTGISVLTARYVSPQIVTFDMKGTMDIFIQQSAQLNLDEAGAKKIVSRFNQAMTESLMAWQQKHHAVILVQPAVVSVQPDITADIRNDIASRMQEAK